MTTRSVKRAFVLVLTFCSLCIACKQNRYEPLFNLADEQRAQGFYEEAIKTYQKIIALDPESWAARQAYLQSGNIYFFSLKNIQAALSIFQNLADSNEGGEEVFEARLRLSEIYHHHLQQYAQAILEYQRLIQNYSRSRDVAPFQMAIADCYFAQNNFKQARAEYRILMEKYRKRLLQERAAFQIGETYYMENNCKEAKKAYEQVIKDFPKGSIFPRAQFGLANCEEELGEYAKALELYRKIINTYPSKAVIQLKISNLTSRMEHLPKSSQNQSTESDESITNNLTEE